MPEKVRQIILVGCGPLEDKYVPEITERRIHNLPEKERGLFESLLKKLNNTTILPAEMEKLQELLSQSDNYCPRKITTAPVILFDEKMHAAIWKEAKQLRTTGFLLDTLKTLKCPVTVLHGEFDPHSVAGVIEPLKKQGVHFNSYILKNCGHSPFDEELTYKEYYSILKSIL